MCLTTRNPTIKITKRDIFVYKDCNIDLIPDICHSGFCNHTYHSNIVQPHVNLFPFEIDESNYVVNGGYHSYNIPNSNTNSLFIIPKGTSYIDGYHYYTNTKNRVSSTIVYIKPVKYNWLQLLLFRMKIRK